MLPPPPHLEMEIPHYLYLVAKYLCADRNRLLMRPQTYIYRSLVQGLMLPADDMRAEIDHPVLKYFLL